MASTAVAGLVGNPPVWLVAVLGAGLIVNGLHILWASRAGRPARAEVFYFATGDALWVAGTAVLIAGGIWITTPAGVAWAIAVAAWVGICGLVQLRLAPET